MARSPSTTHHPPSTTHAEDNEDDGLLDGALDDFLDRFGFSWEADYRLKFKKRCALHLCNSPCSRPAAWHKRMCCCCSRCRCRCQQLLLGLHSWGLRLIRACAAHTIVLAELMSFGACWRRPVCSACLQARAFDHRTCRLPRRNRPPLTPAYPPTRTRTKAWQCQVRTVLVQATPAAPAVAPDGAYARTRHGKHRNGRACKRPPALPWRTPWHAHKPGVFVCATAAAPHAAAVICVGELPLHSTVMASRSCAHNSRT